MQNHPSRTDQRVRPMPRAMPRDTTARTLADLRCAVSEITDRGSIRERDPGDLIVRVPFFRVRATRKLLKGRVPCTVRCEVRAISLREHWTLKNIVMFL